MNTSVGQYLGSHPLVALTVMVFSAMAALPVGLFLIFALVTMVISAVGFVFVEGGCAQVNADIFPDYFHTSVRDKLLVFFPHFLQ